MASVTLGRVKRALVRVLGPTALELDDVEVAVPRQPGRVLALLAARAPAAVSPDALVDALWPDQPPSSATNAVQVFVWRLRKLAAQAGWNEPFVVTEGGRYRLADGVQVDALLLRQATRAARSGRGSGSPIERCATWEDPRMAVRGTPLADLADLPAALDARAELEVLIQHARELKWEDLLMAGRAADVATELARVVHARPDAEREVGLLARALYLQGRQVDALRTLAEHREVLAEEFGLDPSPALGQLERQILLQDPELVPHDRESVLTGWVPLDRAEDRPLGRDGLVAEVLHRLATGSGLVTLVGPGGVGKTTVATEVARRLQEREPAAPVVVVQAASWPTDADLLAGFAAEVLPGDGDSPYRSAVELARDSGATVILDNLEHLTSAASQVPRLVGDLGTTVLATSRRPIGVPGEQAIRVPPLDQGQADHAAAVDVFVRAARRAGSGRPEPELRGLGALVADHVGGLPLGIELAASWLRVLDPRALQQRLGLGIYATVAADVPARHRSLAGLIDEALTLVRPAAASLFVGLSLAAGGSRLPIIEALVPAGPGNDSALAAAGALADLLDAGLVRAAEDPDGAYRYALLPPVHERASIALRERPGNEVDEMRTIWAMAVCRLAVELGPQVRGANGLAVRQVLRREFVHITTAVRWLTQQGNGEQALEAARYLQNFAEMDSRLRDVAELIEATLQAGDGLSSNARANGLNTLALLYPRLGRPGDAVRAVQAALALPDDLDDAVVGKLHTTLAGLLVDESRVEEAQPHLDIAEALRLAHEDVLGTAVVRTHRGMALLQERHYAEAVEALRQVLLVPGIDQFPDAPMTARCNIALALALAGDVPGAVHELASVLESVVALDEEELLAYVAIVGAVASARVRPEAGVRLAGMGLTALRRLHEELEPAESAALDDAISAARASLGDAAFTRCFAAGAAMPVPDVPAAIRVELSGVLARPVGVRGSASRVSGWT